MQLSGKENVEFLSSMMAVAWAMMSGARHSIRCRDWLRQRLQIGQGGSNLKPIRDFDIGSFYLDVPARMNPI